MEVRGAINLKHGTLHPGEEVLAGGVVATYLCSYFDRETGFWKYVLKDEKDIWGGLFEVKEIRHIIHHKQQEKPMKNQVTLEEVIGEVSFH